MASLSMMYGERPATNQSGPSQIHDEASFEPRQRSPRSARSYLPVLRSIEFCGVHIICIQPLPLCCAVGCNDGSSHRSYWPKALTDHSLPTATVTLPKTSEMVLPPGNMFPPLVWRKPAPNVVFADFQYVIRPSIALAFRPTAFPSMNPLLVFPSRYWLLMKFRKRPSSSLNSCELAISTRRSVWGIRGKREK